MKTYIVPMEFVFKGAFFIEADSEKQAEEFALKHCGLVLGGDIHTTLPDDTVDWDFETHPEKRVGHIQ